jgi:hypothetical protein
MNDQFRPDVLYIANQILEHYEHLHAALSKGNNDQAEYHFEQMAVRCQGLEHYVRTLGQYRDVS